MTVVVEETSPATEADFNALFCTDVGGEQETRHDYAYGSGEGYVFVDCETSDTVWEGGLDKRSSLDSVQQSLFFSALTGKQPGIVIYDTDGVEGQYEYRIRIAAELAGVQYLSYDWMAGLQEEIEAPEESDVTIPEFDIPDSFWGFGY